MSDDSLLHELRIVYCRRTELAPDTLGSGGDNKEGSDGGEDRGEGGVPIQERRWRKRLGRLILGGGSMGI